jgi:hypothetical protein
MLIFCPECGREISDKVEACPGCGALQPALDRRSMLAQQSVKRRKVTGIVAAVLVVLLLAGGTTFALTYRWPVIYEVGDVLGTSLMDQKGFAEYVREAGVAWNEAAGRTVLSERGIGRRVRVNLHVDKASEAYVAAHDDATLLNGLHKIHAQRLLEGRSQFPIRGSNSNLNVEAVMDLTTAMRDDGWPHLDIDLPGVTPTEEEIAAARNTEAECLERCWPDRTTFLDWVYRNKPFSGAAELWKDALVDAVTPAQTEITIRSARFVESALLHQFGHALSLPASTVETDVMAEHGLSREVSEQDAAELKSSWRQWGT